MKNQKVFQLSGVLNRLAVSSAAVMLGAVFYAVSPGVSAAETVFSAVSQSTRTEQGTVGNALKSFPSVKIWDAANHNAFTDILEFNGAYYCTFRESSVGHIPGKKTGEGDGMIRILRSTDGESWESAALLKRETFDLRDSKLSVTPDGRLMVVMGGSVYVNQKLIRRCTQVSFSDARGENFTVPQDTQIDSEVRSDFDWLWRVTWHDGIGYGVVYQYLLGQEWKLWLLKTKDGIHYEKISALNVPGLPNETTIRFSDDGKMNLLVRREIQREKGINEAWFGTAEAPFTDWTWKPTGEPLGGPNMIFLPDGRIFAGGRVKGKMGLGFLDEERKFRLFSILESGGDCSYPGFLLKEKELWVSYYAWGKIYLAKIPLSELK